MNALNNRTVAIFASFGVCQSVIDSANSEASAKRQNDKRFAERTFNDRQIGEHLHFTTCRYLAEAMFRNGQHFDILAILLNGEFGDTLAKIATSIAMRADRTQGSADQTGDQRSHTSVIKNLWQESEEIKAIANSIIFDGNQKKVLCVPCEFESCNNKIGSTRKTVVSTWRVMKCYRQYSHDFVRVASMFSAHEIELMNGIMTHNETCSLDRMQYILINGYWCDRTKEMFGPDCVRTNHIGKLFKRKPIDSAIWSSYLVAAVSFIRIMFGDSGLVHKLLTQSRKEKFSGYTPDMPPADLKHYVQKHCTKLEKRIFIESQRPEHQKASDVFRTMELEMAYPPSHATFYRGWENIMRLVDRYIAD